MVKILAVYLLLMNLLTFALFGIDKWKARNHRYRIPETTLLGAAVLGGSIGGICGMDFFHHKTLHKKFKLGLPLILFAQVGLAAIICFL